MKKALSLILTLTIVLSLCACGGTQNANDNQSKANYALYIKDREFFYTDLKEEKNAWQLTSKLIDDENVTDSALPLYGLSLALYTDVSADGSLIFFPDKVSMSDDRFQLYYRKANDTQADAVKIDSDVACYMVNDSATVVTYVKGADRSLYQYSIKDDEKEKIAKEIGDYLQVSDDGSKILYTDAEGTLYKKCVDQEQEKIASGISEVVYQSEDFTTVYYMKNDALYKQVEGSDKVKIGSDIYRVIQVYESGEVYYLKREEEEISLMDYIVDDMKDVDAAAPEQSPTKPRYRNYDTTEEYDKAYETYEKEYEAYLAKGLRDELREALALVKLPHANYALCFFNGTEESVITESLAGDSNSAYAAAEKTAVIFYKAYNQEPVNKIKISEIGNSEDLYSFQEKLEKALFGSLNGYVAVKDTATLVEQEAATGVTVNELGTTVYYVDEIPEGKDCGELYCISIADGAVSTPERYDSDVYSGSCYFVSDDQFLYFKDYKDGNGDLYVNKARVDYDVKVATAAYDSSSDSIFYFTDYDSEKAYGTLKKYHADEAVKIGDDVHAYSVTPDGRVLYVYDYSLKYYTGELHEWNNGESRKIDDDVMYLVPTLFHRDNIQSVVRNEILHTRDNTSTDNWTAAPAAAEW